MEAPSFDALESATQGRYEITGVLGRGGMGWVFAARNRELDSRVAIKVLPPEVSQSTVRLARFKREAALAANLSHPNIVPVFEYGARDGIAYLVMPHILGTTLADEIAERGRLPYTDMQSILRQIGGALAFAHARGIVHRDVKPANILLERDTGRWLITDFGIAHVGSAPDAEITHTGEGLGTPAYMAPEQREGAAEVDGRADLYSLGATTYETLTGTRPATAATVAELARALRKSVPGMSGPLAEVIAAALHTARNDRPDSVDSWLELLAGASQPERTRTTARWVAIGVLGSALLGGWWVNRRPEPRVETRPAIAVLPFAVSSPGLPGGLQLDTILPQAFAWQLRMLPEYRVIGTAVVQSAVFRRFGAEPQELDALIDVAGTLGATAAVTGYGEARDGRITIRIQAHEVQSRSLSASAEQSGPLDSLHALVADIVVETFATRAARERSGFATPSLPRGLPAINAYFRGDRAFRFGDYAGAIGFFDRVVELDSTYAPAYFKRMLAVAQLAPSAPRIRSALEAATTYKDRLDPVSRQLLDGYQSLMQDGDIERARRTFAGIVRDHPDAVDAWFALAELQFHFGPLVGTPLSESKAAFQEVLVRDPSFAAPIGHLITLALAEEDDASARAYMRQYLSVDSTSVLAQLVGAGDTLLYHPRHAAGVLASFRDRPPEFLENLAFIASEFGRSPAERDIGAHAVEVLWERATSREELALAFRMRLSLLLGAGRERAARSLVRQARQAGVPSEEVDRWILLGAVTDLPELAGEADLDRAAARLTDTQQDSLVNSWLLARWHQQRNPAEASDAREGLRRLAGPRDRASPLALSLLDDLSAHDRIAAGDSAGALATWRRATERFNIEQVPFDPVASLWPLRLSRTRLASAVGRPSEALKASVTFLRIAGFVDQAAWPTALWLRAEAARAIGDTVLAANTYADIVDLLPAADGAALAIRTRAERALEQLTPSQ